MTAIPLSASSPREQKAMHRIAVAPGGTLFERLRYALAFGAVYPLFLAGEGALRLSARAMAEPGAPTPVRASAFAEARQNASIALSYALKARTTLRQVARRAHPERLS